jgi:hypothetical protein
VGDSRLYLLRDGELAQLSADHTLAAEMVRSGVMTREQATRSRLGHVLSRAIGTQPAVQVDTLLFDLLPEDRLLLCSDGLSEAIEDSSTVSHLLAGDIQSVPMSLIETANQNDARDNVTVIAVNIGIESDDEPVFGETLRSRFERLQALPLFAKLSLPSIQRVANRFVEHIIEPGTTLVSEGQNVSSLFFVEEGKLVLVDKEQQSLSKIEPGESIGHLRRFAPDRHATASSPRRGRGCSSCPKNASSS